MVYRCMGIVTHERCVLPDDRRDDSGPMTRRQVRARIAHITSNSHDVIANPSRRAWWCHRCGTKVTAKDKVAFVTPRRRQESD